MGIFQSFADLILKVWAYCTEWEYNVLEHDDARNCQKINAQSL